MKNLSPIDKLISSFDSILRNIAQTQDSFVSTRPNPSQKTSDENLSAQEKVKSAALMRVNHAGEVAAQALYQGQALVARDKLVAEKMKQSALEEQEHLHWCNQRIQELESHTSYLDPLWFVGSFAIGVIAGLAGDKVSLGFIAETEKQVVEHLNDHLEKLPQADQKSRVILEQMREDEEHHGNLALESGGAILPTFIKRVMRVPARVMTTVAYYF